MHDGGSNRNTTQLSTAICGRTGQLLPIAQQSQPTHLLQLDQLIAAFVQEKQEGLVAVAVAALAAPAKGVVASNQRAAHCGRKGGMCRQAGRG